MPPEQETVQVPSTGGCYLPPGVTAEELEQQLRDKGFPEDRIRQLKDNDWKIPTEWEAEESDQYDTPEPYPWMGTGTAFNPNVQPPVYTPAPS
jgi:hypothetical protein